MESTTTPSTINAVDPEKEVYMFKPKTVELVPKYLVLHILDIVLSKKYVFVKLIMFTDISLLWLSIFIFD